MNIYEGKVGNTLSDITKREYEIKVNINNMIYLLKLHGMDYGLIGELKEGTCIKFKGILDKKKKEIISPEDIWIRLG